MRPKAPSSGLSTPQDIRRSNPLAMAVVVDHAGRGEEMTRQACIAVEHLHHRCHDPQVNTATDAGIGGSGSSLECDMPVLANPRPQWPRADLMGDRR